MYSTDRIWEDLLHPLPASLMFCIWYAWIRFCNSEFTDDCWSFADLFERNILGMATAGPKEVIWTKVWKSIPQWSDLLLPPWLSNLHLTVLRCNRTDLVDRKSQEGLLYKSSVCPTLRIAYGTIQSHNNPPPPVQCCPLKLLVLVQDFGHSTDLLWGHLYPTDREHEGHDLKCILVVVQYLLRQPFMALGAIQLFNHRFYLVPASS